MIITIGLPLLFSSLIPAAGKYGDLSGFLKDEEVSGTPRTLRFVVSSEVFVANLNYFLPLRKSVTVYIPGALPDYAGTPKIISERSSAEDLSSLFPPEENEESYPDPNIHELSPRETEVLKEIAKGKTFKEIADILCISVNTVVTHRKNLSAKLGIRSVSGLSLYALMNGIISKI